MEAEDLKCTRVGYPFQQLCHNSNLVKVVSKDLKENLTFFENNIQPQKTILKPTLIPTHKKKGTHF